MKHKTIKRKTRQEAIHNRIVLSDFKGSIEVESNEMDIDETYAQVKIIHREYFGNGIAFKK